MTLRSRIAVGLNARFGTRSTTDYLAELIKGNPITWALDVGCGVSSLLTAYRPGIKTIGLDVYTIDHARQSNAHDHYISANLIDLDVDVIRKQLELVSGSQTVGLVTLFGVLEHLPKRLGLEMLEKLEKLSSMFVLLDTPNGYVPQGPEYGNPFQRHLSGWFSHDFEGLGYTLRGSHGTKYMRGYMGEPRVRFPGARLVDNIILSRLLMTSRFPQHAFNICAMKDIRGVPAKYSSYSDPSRI